MRPLRLELKGFTSFREPAEVDFSGLDVFAIAGPTGSGKSSVLDAITYALYGRVERVGDRVSQLISQGQPRMAVTLQFEVGHDRYRVTRSTPAKGATKILLEKQNGDGEWRQAGEGADRVREAEPLIQKAIGLTYDGFTRSVLLPQGKFAEFMVGDAKKRRDILTELLGLSLFRRMAERAGSIARESGVRAQERGHLLEREYADATPEALKAARAGTKAAQKREAALSKAAEHVIEILDRWKEARQTLEDLRHCADEAERVAATVRETTEELGAAGIRLRDASGEAERLGGASQLARKTWDEAAAALAETAKAMGSVSNLTRAQARAHSLFEVQRAREAKVDQIDAASGAAGRLRQALEEAEQAWNERSAALTVREAEAEHAESAYKEAQHLDLVAAVSAGLKVGDPCPVCGLPLERVPKRAATSLLARAEKALDRARSAADAAGRSVLEAQGAKTAAERDLAANAAEQQRLATELAGLDLRLEAERASLVDVLGTPLPADPVAALQARLDGLEQLDRAEREASRLAAEAASALSQAEQERERATAGVQRMRDALSADHRSLFDRASRALGGTAARVRPPPPPASGDVKTLQAFGLRLGRVLGDLATRLATAFDERSSIEQRLVEEANAHVIGLVEPSGTLEAIATSVNAECRRATADVATTAQRAETLADRMESRKRLADEVTALDERGQLFRVLAQELRADRLIAFLQEEALQLLAAAGSDRLSSLSDGRYRILCRGDEFLVVDTWNGDEERSVRTLSGGETFLASLALALALADQVRSLSVTDRARLDSLFLDEGFGTLDQDTLRTVVDAMGQLAADGRLVGVITHVRELAEEFPRIEVEKSHRGSRLRLVMS